MAWAIYNAVTFDLICVDLGINPPQTSDSYVWVESLTGWPTGARDGFVLKCINGVVSWVDTRDFARKRLDKWEQIKTSRTAAIDAPLTTPYGVFDSYAEARSNITDAVLLAQTLAGMGQAVAIAYTLADNQVVTLDLTKMVTVGLMLGSKVQTVRGIATALRTQIEAATTSTQLDAIQWPT